jgi:DNA-binding NarL/FixJ family response regulator
MDAEAAEVIRVLIADDHEIVRRGLRMTIQGETDMLLVGEAVDGRQAVDLALRLHPDVVLMDIQMPGMDGIQAAAELRRCLPGAAVVMLTSFTGDAQLHAALQAGADGYLLKDISGDDLAAAVRSARRGQPVLHPEIARRLMQQMPLPADPFASLTERERQVLQLIARGLSNKEIGGQLFLTEVTVKGYVSALLAKLGVADRTQAALMAVRYGLVSPDDLPGWQS